MGVLEHFAICVCMLGFIILLFTVEYLSSQGNSSTVNVSMTIVAKEFTTKKHKEVEVKDLPQKGAAEEEHHSSLTIFFILLVVGESYSMATY